MEMIASISLLPITVLWGTTVAVITTYLRGRKIDSAVSSKRMKRKGTLTSPLLKDSTNSLRETGAEPRG